METNHIITKRIATLALLLAVAGSAVGQTSYCKGLKNPTSFVVSAGGNSGNAQWYGYEGSREYQASVCGNWGMRLWGTQIPASQLASRSSSSNCSNSTSTNLNGQSDTYNRFVIKGPGTDPLTFNHLSYLPPDSTYTSSIRLGNNCGGTHEAEMLCYQFDVRPQNSLIFIWYALSLQNGQHGAQDNPEFAIEIERRVNANTWERIGGDTLCYIRPTPSGTGSDVSPFYVGSNGLHTGATYECNIYLPWNKVAINLNRYIYETVRIKIGAGDCNYSAHYGCAYIAGECQAMEIKTSGCPSGNTTTVATLTAPPGLTSYTWYKCNSGTYGISSMMSVPENINFTQVGNTSANNTYECHVEDFYLTEGPNADSYSNVQVFRCDMVSAMNPSYPFVSKVYVSVQNTKPTMSIDSVKNCDSELHLTNHSYVPNDDNGCDTSVTKWWFYSGSDTNTIIVDSLTGGDAYHRYDSAALYAVKVRSFNRTDHTCYSDSTYTIFALGRPKTKIHLSADEVCVDETVMLVDSTYNSRRRDWILHGYNPDGSDMTILGHWNNDNQQIQRIFPNYKNPVELVAYNGLFTYNDTNIYDTIWCTRSAFDTVEVFQHPELTVTGDTVVCNGQQTDITVSTETEGCTYRWYRDTLPGTPQIAEGQTLRVLPYDDTCRYYVKVISRKQCVAWDSVNAYRVNPRLSISRHDMCDGDNVTLTAEAAYSYSWTASPADSSLDILLDEYGHGPETITVTPHQTTTYTLIGHGTNNCNADPLTETITVHPVPVATVEYYPNFVDSDNPVVTLTDASPYSVRRVWYFNEGTAVETTSPCSHNFGEVSSDSVEVTMVAYNDLECSDTAIFRLPVTQFTFFAPNIFTPERPDNNTFQIYTANEQENFSIYIYDREGRQVFTSNDLHFKWDGNTNDGLKCSQGAYVYIITYRRPGTEDIVTQKGTITLLR